MSSVLDVEHVGFGNTREEALASLSTRVRELQRCAGVKSMCVAKLDLRAFR